LERFKATEALPVGIFVKFCDRAFIRTVVPVLQDMKPHHEADGLPGSAQRTVILREGLLQTFPINQLGSPQELMIRIQVIRKSHCKHWQLPFCFLKRHANVFSTKSGPEQPTYCKNLQFSKNEPNIHADFKPHFSGRTN
jgi:hypothetical protein